MEIYVRFVAKKKHARSDLKRGWSICAGAHGEKEELRNLVSDGVTIKRTPKHIRVGNIGPYVLKMDGLCGYGPFDTLEAAEDFASSISDNDNDVWIENGNFIAFFEGEYVGDDGMGGDLFSPSKIIKIKNKIK